MKFNMEDMTIGEIILFEETTGKTIGEIGNKPGGRELQALALIALRRENPEATLEDASSVKVSSFMGDTVDPPEAAGPNS